MFGEQDKEYSKKHNGDIPVWQSPRYIEARSKAEELIKSGKYNLTEADFWILKNETKNGKMGYTGLIISHNGCLKINDALPEEKKVNPRCFTDDSVGTYRNSLTYTYCDDEIYEVGEVNPENCKNEYPYAMAFKRCFDRVVLKKCKLAYAGVYSDSEAEEFKEDYEDPETMKITATQERALRDKIIKEKIDNNKVIELLKKYGCEMIKDLSMKDLVNFQEELNK